MNNVHSLSLAELVRLSREHPVKPIVSGLFNEGDIVLIHGSEESFKSWFILQLSLNISAGKSFLRQFTVPNPKRVGVLETEIHVAQLGNRVAKMETDKGCIQFFNSMQQLRRRRGIERKFELLSSWVQNYSIEVVVIDTANDFFRSSDNPNDEAIVGEFFDRLRDLPGQTKIVVRHDRKPKGDGFTAGTSNDQIRGSAEWKEDPETILFLNRVDRRTNKVDFEVGKSRYERKPEPFTLWFDQQLCLLTPLPPPIALLEDGPRSRQELVEQCKHRFGLSARTTDSHLTELQKYLSNSRDGHERILELDFDAAKEAGWYRFLVIPG